MIDKKLLVGGINNDDAEHLIDPKEYLGGMNVRFSTSENGKFNVISNVEGNTKKVNTINALGQSTVFSLPAGTNVTIGAYEDTPNKRVFFFNKNSNGDDGIYCYDYSSDLVYTVLLGSSVDGGLDFNNDIHAVAMIGKLLYWTDNDNPQRRINVEAAMKLNHPTLFPGVDAYVAYTAYYDTTDKMSPSVINLIRNQPWAPPSATKNYDYTYVNNLISGEAFQFCYRFVYRDYEISTLSPLSALSNYNQESDNYNRITVSIPLDQKIEQDVLRVEMAVKYVNGGKMFVVKTFSNGFDDHNSGTTPLSFSFYNDVVGSAIGDSDSIKQFDSIPVKSGALEIAKDRLFLGNNTSGYESPSSTSLTLSTTTYNPGSTSGYWFEISWYTNQYNTSWNTVHLIDITGLSSNSGYYAAPGYPTTSYYYNASDYVGAGIQNVAQYYGFSMGRLRSFSNTGIKVTITGPYPAPVTAVNKYIFKTDSSYKLGVVFYDYAGRKCGVVTSDALKTVIPDRQYSLNSDFITNINWQLINNGDLSIRLSEIPEWAHYYSVVMTKCLRTTFFMQMKATDVKYISKDSTGAYTTPTATYSETAYGIVVKLDGLNKYKMGYSFQEGDILKLYGSDGIKRYLKVKDVYSDYVVVDLANLGTIVSYIYEIYTPYTESINEYFYEKGVSYKINNPGTIARQYSTLSGSFTGDVILLQRTLSSTNFLTEAMSPNDLYWKIWNTNIGRTNIVSDADQSKDGVNIVYSNVIITGTQTNGLSSFEALNFSRVPIELNKIQALRLVNKIEAEGTVMLAIGEQETASIYLGEAQLFDNTGSSFLAKSSGVIGNMNVLRGSFGTTNPESISRFLGQVYWFDANKGCVVRYDSNGLFPISSYKMFKYFKKVGQSVLKNGFKVYGGVDPYHLEVLMFVPRVSLEPSGTVLIDQILLSQSYSNDGAYYVQDGYGNTVEDGGSNKVIYQSGSNGDPSNYEISVVVGRIYRVVGSGVTINYAGQSWSSGQYFVATDEYPTISIQLATGGEFTLYELVRPVYEMYDNQGGVLVYKTDIDRWVSMYSYRPEWLSMVGNRLVSFKSGYLYLHDSQSYNTFYGNTVDSSIAFAHNEAGNITKLYNSVSIEGDTPSRIHVRTEVPNVQSSDIVATTYDDKTFTNGDFKVKEGVSYAEIFRDRFSPNVSGTYDQKVLIGDKIRGELAKFQVVFLQPNTKKNIKFANVGYVLSRGNTTQNLK